MEKNIYENIYSEEKNLGRLSDNPRIKVMASMANALNLSQKNILDIGCYDGTSLSLIKNKNNLFGLEASDWATKKAKGKGIAVTKFFFDDKTRMPYENGFFDLVIAGEIIEHIYDTDFFLEEIRRILKSGGKLLISTPNLASLGRRIMLLIGRSPVMELSPNEKDSSGHIRYFTLATFSNLLRKHGFRVILYKSDVLNFSSSGKIRSHFFARLFPKLGASLIVLAQKK